MKNKIIGIFVFILLIGTLIIPNINGLEEQKNKQIDNLNKMAVPGEYTFENVYVLSAGYYSNGNVKITFKCDSLIYNLIINLVLKGIKGYASNFFKKLFLPSYFNLDDTSFAITAEFTEPSLNYGTYINEYKGGERILVLWNQKYTITAKYNAKNFFANHASFDFDPDILTQTDIIIIMFQGDLFEKVTVVVPNQ